MKPFDFNKYIKNNPLLKESKQLNKMREFGEVIATLGDLESVLGAPMEGAHYTFNNESFASSIGDSDNPLSGLEFEVYPDREFNTGEDIQYDKETKWTIRGDRATVNQVKDYIEAGINQMDN